MAWGRRCDMGCESWPDDKKYEKCPVCGQETTRFSNLRPLDNSEAAHAAFEAYYAKIEAQRKGLEPQMTPEETLYWEGKYPGGKSSDSPRKSG